LATSATGGETSYLSLWYRHLRHAALPEYDVAMTPARGCRLAPGQDLDGVCRHWFNALVEGTQDGDLSSRDGRIREVGDARILWCFLPVPAARQRARCVEPGSGCALQSSSPTPNKRFCGLETTASVVCH